MSDSPELTRLRQAVRESRLGIAREYAGLVTALDFRTRFTRSVRRHPLGWIGGAAAAGLVAALFGGRASRKAPVRSTSTAVPVNAPAAAANPLSKAGWMAGALELGKLLYPILRPVVMEYVSNAAQAGLARRDRRP